MKFLMSLTLLAVVASCSSKQVVLEKTDYDLKDKAKVTVQFLKQKSKKYDIGLLGISTKDDAVVIKKEEIGCGKGAEAGIITKFIKIEKEPFIIFSRANFKDFVLVCENQNFKNVEGNVYVSVKNIYSLKDGAPGNVLASDMKIELK